MKKNYIGVTGFMDRTEVEAVLSSLPEGFNRKVMIGMLVSGKTVKGIPNKWPKRYPMLDMVGSVFMDHPNALNLVHYNTKEEDPVKIVEELYMIEELAGPNFHGFQLNMVWPSPSMINLWLRNRGSKTIVLQCGSRAMAEINNSPEQLVEKSKNYEGIADYLLLDPSGGLGQSFNYEHLLLYLDALHLARLNTRFGVAGGLSPETFEPLMIPILERFPDVSIDAEGRLRTKEDKLDTDIANKYISLADKIFRKHENVLS